MLRSHAARVLYDMAQSDRVTAAALLRADALPPLLTVLKSLWAPTACEAGVAAAAALVRMLLEGSCGRWEREGSRAAGSRPSTGESPPSAAVGAGGGRAKTDTTSMRLDSTAEVAAAAAATAAKVNGGRTLVRLLVPTPPQASTTDAESSPLGWHSLPHIQATAAAALAAAAAASTNLGRAALVRSGAVDALVTVARVTRGEVVGSIRAHAAAALHALLTAGEARTALAMSDGGLALLATVATEPPEGPDDGGEPTPAVGRSTALACLHQLFASPPVGAAAEAVRLDIHLPSWIPAPYVSLDCRLGSYPQPYVFSTALSPSSSRIGCADPFGDGSRIRMPGRGGAARARAAAGAGAGGTAACGRRRVSCSARSAARVRGDGHGGGGGGARRRRPVRRGALC